MGFLENLRAELRATKRYSYERTGRRSFFAFSGYSPWYTDLAVGLFFLVVGTVIAAFRPELTAWIIMTVGGVVLARGIIRYWLHQRRRRH